VSSMKWNNEKFEDIKLFPIVRLHLEQSVPP